MGKIAVTATLIVNDAELATSLSAFAKPGVG